MGQGPWALYIGPGPMDPLYVGVATLSFRCVAQFVPCVPYQVLPTEIPTISVVLEFARPLASCAVFHTQLDKIMFTA